jgi:hypothetical protein
MQIMLQCGHVTLGEIGADWFPCPHCQRELPPMAIECREWHTGCNSCRYGRWCGQDKTGANLIMSTHALSTGHSMHCDYMVHPDTKERMRQAYGRKVRLWFDAVPVPKPFPVFKMLSGDKTLLPETEVPPF